MLVKVFAMSRLDFSQGVWKGDSYRQSALIPTCYENLFNHTLIIHANVYDQDQGLMGRYHNTTLDTNQNNTSFILKARGLEGSNTSSIHKSQRKQHYLSTDISLTRMPYEY